MSSSNKNGLCLLTILQRYIRLMLDAVSGFKVMILDQATLGIISLIYGQSDILEKDVYLVERIEQDSDDVNKDKTAEISSSAKYSAATASTITVKSNSSSMRHLNALYFVRPTGDNILRIVKELKKPHPRFNEYHLMFSSTLSKQQLERIAKSDEHEVVRQVCEYFADIFVINPSLFSLDLPSLGMLPLPESLNWNPYEETLFKRICDGLLSALLCVLKTRFIGTRFPRGSEICRKIANQLHVRFSEECDILNNDFSTFNQSVLPIAVFLRRVLSTVYLNSFCYFSVIISDSTSGLPNTNGCILLLFDRRDDPVTPLLNQWTFQAMVHELIGINKNKIHLETYRETDASDATTSDVVLSVSSDPFFATHWNSNFGDLGPAIQNYVKTYRQKTQSTDRVESVEEARQFVDRYPEFRKLSGNVSKHVAIGHELGRIIQVNGLFEGSLLEQDLACVDNKSAQYKSVLERLRNAKVPKFEKLRLVALYALRYEGDPNIGVLKEELKKSGIDESQVDIVDALINQAGIKHRSSELFQKMDLLQIAKSVVQRGFKGTPNVYTQHSPYLASIVEAVIKGRVKETQYTFIPNTIASYTANPPQQYRTSETSTSVDRPSEIVVFVVGGATYEEACALHQLAKQHDITIVLGGSTIHNSKSFLADITQLNNAEAQRHTVKGWDSWDRVDNFLAPHSTPRSNESKQKLKSSGAGTPNSRGSQELVTLNPLSRTKAPNAAVERDINRDSDLISKQQFVQQKW